MIDFYFERSHCVLMARISGVFDGAAVVQLDDAVARFAADRSGLRAVYDFSELEGVTLPPEHIAARARKPPVIEGRRVIIASRVAGGGLAHSFSNQQASAGERAPLVVDRLEAAYVLLGLGYRARFEPVVIA